MRDIIIIGHEPLTKKNKSCFFINEYIDKGLSVEYWDASVLFYPEMYLNDEIQESYIKKFDTLQLIENQLKCINVSKFIFIIEVNENWDNRRFFKLLNKYNCYTIYIDMYGNSILPIPLHDRIYKLFTKNFFTSLNNLLKRIIYKLYKKYFHIKSFQKVFTSSEIIYHTDKINHPDYEEFKKLEINKTNIFLQNQYIVFIDTYYPYHPDLKHIYKIKESDGRKYQQTINSLFTFLEKKYKIPVIIAAHPKAEYNGDEFDGRKIIKYKTNELIFSSKIVILHASNAISYVVLGNKSPVFITTDDYNSSPILSKRIKALANILGKEVYNIDTCNFQLIKISKIKNYYRYGYIYNYLTSKETEDKRNIDILLSFYHSLL